MKILGFHLIELLIALSIVGILAAVALPNYTAHLTQSRRLLAKAALIQLAGHMETFFITHHSYEGANFTDFGLPEYIADNHYRLMIETAPMHFKLTAIPQGAQAQQDRPCGTLSFTSEGEQQSSGTGNLNECWS